MSNAPMLEIKGLNKWFGSTHANRDVDFNLQKGEIRGVIGENGSGKSTLLSQIAGIYKNDTGAITLNGEAYAPHSPVDANKRGIAIVVQELGAVSNLTAALNVFLADTKKYTKYGLISNKKLFGAINEILEKWDLPRFPLRAYASDFNVEMRKMLELTRALSIDPDILILDEITQSLSHNNRDKLYGLIDKFRAMGKSIILITHDVEEMIEITDTITVMRDGEIVGTEKSADLTVDKLKSMMIGRTIEGDYYRRDHEASHGDEVLLKTENIVLGEQVRGVSFEVREGEILGFCGLSDSGIHSIGKAVYGLEKLDGGTVSLKAGGGYIEIRDSQQARQNGMGYVPKDRDAEALMMNTTILENASIPSLDEVEGKAGYLSPQKLKDIAQSIMELFDVKANDIHVNMSSLSGGNKQKVNLGRWLVKDLKVLVVDCPTRGVDVGVKAFIYALLREAKEKGLAIVWISDELTELLGMSDRLIVMKEGKITGESVRGEQMTEEAVIEVMI